MRAHAVLSSLEFRVKQGKLSRAACKHSTVKLRGKQGGMLDFESQLRADSKRNTNRRSPISERELRRRPTNHRLFLPACLAALLSKVGQARIFKQAETTWTVLLRWIELAQSNRDKMTVSWFTYWELITLSEVWNTVTHRSVELKKLLFSRFVRF